MVLFTGDSKPEGVGDEDAVTLQPSHDEFEEAPQSRQQLEKDLRVMQQAAYARGTLKNLLCQWRFFFEILY